MNNTFNLSFAIIEILLTICFLFFLVLEYEIDFLKWNTKA